MHRRSASFSAGSVKQHASRTSLDLELDLQASETKLSHLHDEIERLRKIKQTMQEARARGENELPSWFADESLQQLLLDADKLVIVLYISDLLALLNHGKGTEYS